MPPDPPHRARERFTKLSVTVRMLRDFCFPHGWQRNRDWPAIRRALWKARDYVIPNGRGGWWLPFLLAEDPGHDAALDDLVVLVVQLPSGAAHGPVIDRRDLARLGVDSAPKFRAYIAAHSVAWRPGVTRRRHPRDPRVHLWSSDPGNYPVLTAEDRRRLALGDGDGHPGTTLGDLVMVAIDLPNRGFGRPTNPQSIDLFATSTPTPTGGGGEEIVGAPLERARPTPSLPGQKGSELSQVQSGVRAQGALRRPLWRSGAAPYRGCDGSDEGVRSRPT